MSCPRRALRFALVLVCVAVVVAQVGWAQSLAEFEKKVTEFTLDNGLKFIFVERHQAPVVSLFTYADVGSVDEVKGITGMAHLFEHMAFKGTTRINTNNYPAEKAASVVLAINTMKAEIEKMTNELVTDKELDQAKNLYLNSFVFNFDTTGAIVERVMTYEYYGYPKDFLQKEREGVEKVSKEDVLRVAGKYLHPDKLRILAVGNPEKFDQPLSALGEVHEIDITILEPEEEKR